MSINKYRKYSTTHHFDKLNLKAVLFDMDGVLFDSMKNHAAAWHEAMSGAHDPSPEEAYMHEGRTGALFNNQYSKVLDSVIEKQPRWQ